MLPEGIMPVSITVAPSPNRHKSLNLAESRYLIELGSVIAENHPQSTVVTRYGDNMADVMVMRQASDHDVELF